MFVKNLLFIASLCNAGLENLGN